MCLAVNSKQQYVPKIIGCLFISDKGINSQPHFTELETISSSYTQCNFSLTNMPYSLVQKHEQSPWLFRQNTPVPSNIAENPVV